MKIFCVFYTNSLLSSSMWNFTFSSCPVQREILSSPNIQFSVKFTFFPVQFSVKFYRLLLSSSAWNFYFLLLSSSAWNFTFPSCPVQREILLSPPVQFSVKFYFLLLSSSAWNFTFSSCPVQAHFKSLTNRNSCSWKTNINGLY